MKIERLDNKHRIKPKGFTLIEVMVALVITGLVLAGLFSTIQSQIDRRFGVQERYLGQISSWNRLLEQYQVVQEWTPRGERLGEQNGDTEILGRDWYWQLEVQETFGENFFRYEVQTFKEASRSGRNAGMLVAFFVAENQ